MMAQLTDAVCAEIGCFCYAHKPVCYFLLIKWLTIKEI